MVYRQIARCYALGRSLRGLNPLEGISGLLTNEEIGIIKSSNNKPLTLIQKHSYDLAQLKQKGELELFSQIQIDATLVRLCASMGWPKGLKELCFQ